MLQVKIGEPKQSRDGRSLVVTDSTGLESLGRDTGYGPENKPFEDIVAHYFSISRYGDSNAYLFKLDGSDEYLPTSQELAQGYPLTLKTTMFNEGTDTSRSKIFTDGIVDVNMYVEFPGFADVVITKGGRSVTFSAGNVGNFTPVLEADAIVVNDIIYQIDKSEDNNGATVFYVIGSFEESATSFGILYRSNVKVLLKSVADYLHSYGVKMLKNDIDSPFWDNVNTALSFMMSSVIWFEEEDYAESHEEIVAANKLLIRFR